MSDAPLILKDIRRSFHEGQNRLDVLCGLDLTIETGQSVALVGPSGAGKSTLLHIAGLLERPTSGTVMIDGLDASRLDEKNRTRLRLTHLGFVYQFHHLLPEFSALENVMIPQMILNLSKDQARERAEELLAAVGLSARKKHLPGELSGGERQRVAVARALANRPKILLADEPTGNLDPPTAAQVFALFLDLARQSGLSILMVTHNLELAARFDRIVEMRDGVLISREKP